MHGIRVLERLGVDGIPIGKFGVRTQGKLNGLPILKDLMGNDEPSLNGIRIVGQRTIRTWFRAPEDWGSINEALQHAIGVPGRKIRSECLKIAIDSDPQDLFALGRL